MLSSTQLDLGDIRDVGMDPRCIEEKGKRKLVQ